MVDKGFLAITRTYQNGSSTNRKRRFHVAPRITYTWNPNQVNLESICDFI